MFHLAHPAMSATLVAALDSNALPALEHLYLDGIPASDASKTAVMEALERSSQRAAALARAASAFKEVGSDGLEGGGGVGGSAPGARARGGGFGRRRAAAWARMRAAFHRG